METAPFSTSVPTAPLLRISLARLLAREKEEEERLWDACRELGFFYLDLRTSASSSDELASTVNGHANRHANGHTNGHANGSKSGDLEGDGAVDGDSLLRDAGGLFDVAARFFDLEVEEKRKYDFSEARSYFGYVYFSPIGYRENINSIAPIHGKNPYPRPANGIIRTC